MGEKAKKTLLDALWEHRRRSAHTSPPVSLNHRRTDRLWWTPCTCDAFQHAVGNYCSDAGLPPACDGALAGHSWAPGSGP